MQSYGLSARITGNYWDGAFSREIGPNPPFDTHHGLTPGLPDVGTETVRQRRLIRRWIRHPFRKVSLYGAVICRISVALRPVLPGNRAEENLSKDRP